MVKKQSFTDNNKDSLFLPQGWIPTTLGDISNFVVSVNTKEKPTVEFDYLDIASIDNNLKKITTPKKYLGKDAPSRARQLIQTGDILFSTVRTYLKNYAIVDSQYDGQIASTGFCVIRASSGINNKFVFYFIQTDQFLNPLNELQRGTSYPAVRDSDVFVQPISLPPLPEQHRIVLKIEGLFTQLDAGVASLKKAQTQLKRYRQAVLKAAFEGRLTKEWRKEHKGEIEPAKKLVERIEYVRQKNESGKNQGTDIDFSHLDPLPNTWIWIRLDHLAFIRGGITKDSKRIVENGRQVPYLRVANVQNGYLDLHEMKTIEASEEEIHDLLLKSGDILFTEGGDRDKLGRGWIWQNEISECIYQNHIFRARLYLDEISPKYVSWFGNTHSQKYFMKQGKQTTNLASISLTQLRAFPVALPPITEQKEIINEIERHFSQIDHLETTLTSSLLQAESLRQSILKRAFEGKLVPQDPNDEPASVLLERINAEKTKTIVSNKKKNTPKSTKSGSKT